MIDFSKRTLTSFNLSIGTGLMFESLFTPTEPRYDVERVIPNSVVADNYSYHYINLLTLVRNIISSFQVRLEPDAVMKPSSFVDCLKDEIATIDSLYQNTNCQPVFYLPDFEDLKKIYNKGKDREETEPVERFFKIYKRLKKLNLSNNFVSGVEILEDIIKLPRFSIKEKVLITTNLGVDLNAPGDISLLDSHTGVLYPRSKFYVKYNKIGSKDMSVLPMNEYILYLVGDTTLSLIIDPKTRLRVYEMAIENTWNQKTSEYHIKSRLQADPMLKMYLKNFKPVY